MSHPENSGCLLHRVPRPPLSTYIKCIWYASSYSAAHNLEKVLPTATVDLVIRLDQDRIRIYDDLGRCQSEVCHAVFRGALSRPAVIETKQQASVMGVHFRPGGAAMFFARPFGELANLAVAAEDIWGADIRLLREQLLEAGSPAAMFHVLETALLRRLNQPSNHLQIILRALGQFSAAPNLAIVRRVGDATGYSPRRFIERFEHYVGLTPKVICRVLRFQAVLEQIAEQRAVNWSSVALDCGYFDQSHLIRDFRAFAGICPSQYRPVQPDRPNHIAVQP